MDPLKLLQKLGLTEYESRAYLALAELGPSTVREIVLHSKLPRNKAYEALQHLEEKNKVISLPVSPRKYKISGPETFKEEVDRMQTSVENLIKVIQSPKKKEFRDLFWVIKGQKAIMERMVQQNKKTQRELLMCNRLSVMGYKYLQTMRELRDQGVAVKMICKFDPKKIPMFNAWLGTGVEMRIFNETKFGPLIPRISIYDSSIARLTIGSPEVKSKEDYMTLWTESRAFAQMLRTHFLNMWKECKPIEFYIKKRNL